MDVPNVPASEPVEPSTGARTASASQHNTRLRRRTRESGASTAVDDAQHEKSALAPASDALPVTDRENPPEGRVAWDTTRPGGTRASVEIPTRPSWPTTVLWPREGRAHVRTTNTVSSTSHVGETCKPHTHIGAR